MKKIMMALCLAGIVSAGIADQNIMCPQNIMIIPDTNGGKFYIYDTKELLPNNFFSAQSFDKRYFGKTEIGKFTNAFATPNDVIFGHSVCWYKSEQSTFSIRIVDKGNFKYYPIRSESKWELQNQNEFQCISSNPVDCRFEEIHF